LKQEDFQPAFPPLLNSVSDSNQREHDWAILSKERWSALPGHSLTFVGLLLFTFTLYFRPYELIPALSGLNSIALILAIVTLLVYLPTQFTLEGTITALPVEVKCILFIAFWALLTMPIAGSPSVAWEKFNEQFIKVVIIFVVMVNVLRTKKRMVWLMWLGIAIGVMLSYEAINLYREGVFEIEGYRVKVDFGGMFGNPNDMAVHLVVFVPISAALGFASRNLVAKIIYFLSTAIMIGGITVTQSRGGFLGLLVSASVMAWKMGRKNRLKVILISTIVVIVFINIAPGNYGRRILSIFIPSLDPVKSSDQRKTLLIQSIWVTLRNPAGIGIGNFPIVGSRNLETHNAFTQVSAELGWLAFIAYMTLLVSPLRKLRKLERLVLGSSENRSLYFLTIGVYASIVGYMVSSFFGPVAYNWYVYYPIAYAICLRRIYAITRIAKADEDLEVVMPEPESA
jgi:putative inorganic carbon (HCO3(-)) transporter